MKSCLGDAVRYGLIPENPCIRVRLPLGPSEEIDIWSTDEVRRFLSVTTDSRYATLWRLLLATGMRRGEALGLQWADIDLDAGKLRIVRAMLADSRRHNLLDGAPKNQKSRRTISLDSGTVQALRAWQAQRLQEADSLAATDPVFTLANGSPMLPAGVSDAWRRAVRYVGMRPLPLHGTRHTHISHLLSAGEPLAHVSARVGHANATLTLRTYAHVIAGDDARTAERAGQLFESEAPADAYIASINAEATPVREARPRGHPPG